MQRTTQSVLMEVEEKKNDEKYLSLIRKDFNTDEGEG